MVTANLSGGENGKVAFSLALVRVIFVPKVNLQARFRHPIVGAPITDQVDHQKRWKGDRHSFRPHFSVPSFDQLLHTYGAIFEQS